jgi:two-component system sensor histidine kinase AlgZ
MHPILTRRGRIGPYLVAWAPLAGLLTGLMRATCELSWFEALIVVVPVAVVYAFVCLAAWYPCKAVPLSAARLPRLVVTHVVAGCVSAMLLLFLADTWVVTLEQAPRFAELGKRFQAGIAPLLGAGVVFYLLVAALHYLIVAFENARKAEARELQLSLLAREAELRALKAQINPHFLFNALNSISALTTADPAGARQMCNLLAEFLRESLRVASCEHVTLGEELALVEKYLAVEQVRFGQRLRVERAVSAAAAKIGVPPLLLQPLAENAVRHGIAHLVSGGTIRIAAEVTRGELHIRVDNPVEPGAPASTGRGVGLANVKARLEAFTDGGGHMLVDGGREAFRVELLMPGGGVE